MTPQAFDLELPLAAARLRASWCLAPASEGRYEIAPAWVQGWLGHGQLSTTLDTYVHKSIDNDDHLRSTMLRLPGRHTND